MRRCNYFLLFILIPLLFSCVKKDKTPTVFEVGMPPMVVTSSDTVAVKQLVEDFLNHLKNGQTQDAIYMLYDGFEKDASGSPLPLSEEKCQSLIPLYSQFKVSDFTFKNITFETIRNNEVEYAVVLDNSVTVKWTFKPIRAYGRWYLSLKDSTEGDLKIVK